MGRFPEVCRQVKELLILELHEMIRAVHAVASCFMIDLWLILAGRSFQSYEKWSFVSVFSHLSPFPQVFGQVKWWLMLALHEIIRVSHVVAWQIVFLLFYEWGWQGGVFKVMKNDHFLLFLAVWILFPKLMGRLSGGLY